MNNHVTERELEILLLAPDTYEDKTRSAIRTHLDECHLCAEQWNTLKAFYRKLHEHLNEPPTPQHEELADYLIAGERKRLSEGREIASLQETVERYAGAVEPYRPTVLQRFIRWIRIRPYRFATASAFGLAALALLTMTVRTPKDTNPVLAEVKKGALRVYNKEGQELWSRTALKIPDGSTRFGFDRGPLGAKSVALTDIDGNGKNVVLVTGLTSSRHGLDSLHCFEGDGSLRWRAGAGRFATFGKRGVGLFGEPAFIATVVLKKKETPPRLFAIVGSIGFSPTKVIELDTRTGRELHAYHHRGGNNVLFAMDIDKDGNQELISAGLNDGFDRASITVLDPDMIDGHAPVPAELLPLEKISRAKEKYCILLPVSDLGKARSYSLYNVIEKAFALGENTFVVHALEYGARDSTLETAPAVGYVFGDSMRVVSVLGDDNFLKIYQKWFPNKPNIKLNLAYWNELKDSVLYWDGEKFVHTPTMNKRYASSKMLP